MASTTAMMDETVNQGSLEKDPAVRDLQLLHDKLLNKKNVTGKTALAAVINNSDSSCQRVTDEFIRFLRSNVSSSELDSDVQVVVRHGAPALFSRIAIFGRAGQSKLLVLSEHDRDELLSILQAAYPAHFSNPKVSNLIDKWVAECLAKEAESTARGGVTTTNGDASTATSFTVPEQGGAAVDGRTLDMDSSLENVLEAAAEVFSAADKDKEFEELRAERPLRQDGSTPLADSNPLVPPYKLKIIQSVATLQKAEEDPVISFGFGDANMVEDVLALFDGDQREPFNLDSYYPDKVWRDATLSRINKIDSLLVGIFRHLSFAAPTGTPVKDALQIFDESVRTGELLVGSTSLLVVNHSHLSNKFKHLMGLVDSECQSHHGLADSNDDEIRAERHAALLRYKAPSNRNLTAILTEFRQQYESYQSAGGAAISDALLCKYFVQGLEQTAYGKLGAEVQAERRRHFRDHKGGVWGESLSNFVVLMKKEPAFKKISQPGGGESGMSKGQKKKAKLRAKRAAAGAAADEDEDAALSNGVQDADQADGGGTKPKCPLCGSEDHSVEKCPYIYIAKKVVEHSKISSKSGACKRGQLGPDTYRAMMKENETRKGQKKGPFNSRSSSKSGAAVVQALQALLSQPAGGTAPSNKGDSDGGGTGSATNDDTATKLANLTSVVSKLQSCLEESGLDVQASV